MLIFFVLLLPGLAGIFLPIPGLLYMFVISLIFGFVNEFNYLTQNEIIILGIITIIAVLNDYLSGMLGAKYGGAAQKSMILGIIGMIIGTILLPPFGGLIGVFLGILIAEIMRHGNRQKAIRAASGGLIGSVVGMIFTLILAIVFLFLFIFFSIK